MKRLLLLGILVVVGVFFVRGYTKENSAQKTQETLSNNSQKNVNKNQSDSLNPENPVTINSRSVFVPYWNLNGPIPSQYDKVMYFGIAANQDGIIQDAGYKNISSFNDIVNDSQTTYLTVRMLDSEANLEILENPSLQNEIIKETVQIAQKNGFDGVVIDLELSVLPLENVKTQINQFIEGFNSELDENNLQTAVALYGDVFYRARPFDATFIGKNSDEIMIMAYDFSKSFGEPGPNFPLAGKEEYGYDFQTMINDYVKAVPAEKLNVIFGLYGWNWPIGAQGKPLTRATAMSINDISDSFLDSCSFSSCVVERDEQSAESTVTYVDKEGDKHIVWFEDQDSVDKKKEYVQRYGISSIGYWVWGYF